MCNFTTIKKLQYKKQNTLVIKIDLSKEFNEIRKMQQKQPMKLLTA